MVLQDVTNKEFKFPKIKRKEKLFVFLKQLFALLNICNSDYI